MRDLKHDSHFGEKPRPTFGTPPLAKGRGWAWGLFPLLAILFLSACATQDDADVLFSDTEMAIIKTLVYTDPPDDPTNNYDQSEAAATLGQKFFWDRQFSGSIVITGNRTTTPSDTATDFSVGDPKRVSCASCHNPDFGWADNATKPNDVSLGANFTSRNSPTVLNSAHNTYSLWDGGVDSLWAVARPAIEGNPHNFGRLGVAYVICRSLVANQGDYRSAYDNVFGSGSTPETTALCGTINSTLCGGFSCAPRSENSFGKGYNSVTGAIISATDGLTYGSYGNIASATNRAYVDTMFANFGKAIAAYERKIVSKNSAFDQWVNGNESAMTAAQKRGLKVFIGKGNCIRCHSGTNFSDGKFHNLGVPQVGGLSGSNDQGRFDGISKLKSATDNGVFNTTTSLDDSGAATDRVSSVTATSADIGAFKTPTLRSVNKTPPYFHNGTFASLWDVVNFYNFAGNGGNSPGTKDTILTTRRMTNEEMEDLVSFLKALEGEALSTSLTTNTSPTAACANLNDTACNALPAYAW